MMVSMVQSGWQETRVWLTPRCTFGSATIRRCRWVASLILAATVAAVCVGCSGTSYTGSSPRQFGSSPGDESKYDNLVLERLYEQSQLEDPVTLGPSLLDSLPGSDFSKTVPFPWSRLLVTGVVTAVDEGDSDHIDTLIMNVTFKVQHDICSVDVPPSTLTLSFPTHGDVSADDLKAAFDELGEVALFLRPLHRPGVTHGLTTSLMLSPVGDDGTVEWTLAADALGRSWVKGGTTSESLENACQASST
jgi:hypothetical protein